MDRRILAVPHGHRQAMAAPADGTLESASSTKADGAVLA